MSGHRCAPSWTWSAALAAVLLGGCGEPGSAPGAASTTSTPAPAPAASSTLAAASSTASSSAPGASAAPSASSAPAAGRCPEGMVFVPEGTFRMGSPPEDRDADPDERPAHDVNLPAYCIGKTEITVAEYERCVNEPRGGERCSPASTKVVSRGLSPDDVIFWSKFCNAGVKDRADHPVNCVDWAQAGAYCRWAGGRLPSEAEWEHAARGPDGRRYPWGSEPPGPTLLNACGGECARAGAALGRGDKKKMYDGDDGSEVTAPPGKYPAGASPFGALDMAGNVWEWTADGYGPYTEASTGRPAEAKGPDRVVRGGHWLTAGPLSPRGANREKRDGAKKLEDVGFRCASDPSP